MPGEEEKVYLHMLAAVFVRRIIPAAVSSSLSSGRATPTVPALYGSHCVYLHTIESMRREEKEGSEREEERERCA